MLASLAILLFLGLRCLETQIAPPRLERWESSYKKGHFKRASPKALPSLSLSWRGKNLDKRSWLKALSISRLFYSGIHNRSGSFKELLAPSLRKLAEQKGFRTIPSHHHDGQSPQNASNLQEDMPKRFLKGKSYALAVHVKRNLLLWLPPVEFIQTPRPRRQGTIVLDFLIITQLLKDFSLPPKILWTRTFQKKEKLPVFPGNEKESLEILAHRALTDYLRQIESAFKERGR